MKSKKIWTVVVIVAVVLLVIFLIVKLGRNNTSFAPVYNQTNQTGSLSVTSVPSSASLYIDGSYKGLTPLTVSSLIVGSHSVQVTKSGYNSYSTSKYIYVGNNTLSVILTLAAKNQTNQTV